MHDYIECMPKVELHVHLEGSVQPDTLIRLARKHKVDLPSQDPEGIKSWFTFKDFRHFIDIYMTISSCLRTADDIEEIAYSFLQEQARQNICHSEVTFTPYNQLYNNGLGFNQQIDAVNRARRRALETFGVTMGLIIDIPRLVSPADGERIAEWVIERYGDGVIAMGLGGPEEGQPPSKYRRAFERVQREGIPCILHAGETAGPESIRDAIDIGKSIRIGHGVRAMEDNNLLNLLKQRKIPLEVCPSSNVCLGIYPSLIAHPIDALIEMGITVTLNSDDPPMFNTSLTQEFIRCQHTFKWDSQKIHDLVLNAITSSLLPERRKQELTQSARNAKQDFDIRSSDGARSSGFVRPNNDRLHD